MRFLLAPISWLYGLGCATRNLLYDLHLFKATASTLPVICVGNLLVGGTGKTPMIEFLINRLPVEKHEIAILTRGYRRRTRGTRIAGENESTATIGDEPMQIHRKFPEVTIVVDSNRRRALHLLEARPDPPKVVLMDDGFQHRSVKPRACVVLCDYRHLPYNERLLPWGKLRESAKALKRADMVVVTKVPPTIENAEQSAIRRQLKIDSSTPLFFSSIAYGEALTIEGQNISIPSKTKVTAVTGVANPAPFYEEIDRRFHRVHTRVFSDHHTFSLREIRDLEQVSPESWILTTEKDAVRLREADLSDSLRRRILYLPISTEILPDSESFIKTIKSYVNTI